MSLRPRPLPTLLAITVGALPGLLAGLALAGPASVGASDATGSAAQATPGPRAGGAAQFPTPTRAKLRLQNSPFGKVIFEQRSGFVAYLFTSDPKKASTCTGDCATAWPPIKTRKRPAAGSGVKRRHLGTVKRSGGGKIVTYRGRALYFYQHDSRGSVGCHDVPGFGGHWYAVNKAGKPA